MNNHAYAVILAGGSGERFWPLSTQSRPKQFVSLFGGRALIRHAVDRLEGLIPPERIIIITAANLVEPSAAACDCLPRENIIGEPCRRDTAAACALACGIVAARDPEGIAIILTADQIMTEVDTFRQLLADSVEIARDDGVIVTIGIEPDYPATGFGYIEAADTLQSETKTVFRRAMRYVEKPDLETAKEYLATGNFYWNAGMFIWSVKTMADAVMKNVPGLEPLLTLPSKVESQEELIAKLAEVYPDLIKISVDYAIMEHHKKIIMAKGSFGWDDVGSWPSVSNHLPVDQNGNATSGKVELLDSKDNIVISDGNRLTAIIGLDDIVVAQTKNATLVCPKSRAQELKKLVSQIAAREDGKDFV